MLTSILKKLALLNLGDYHVTHVQNKQFFIKTLVSLSILEMQSSGVPPDKVSVLTSSLLILKLNYEWTLSSKEKDILCFINTLSK